MKLEKMSYTEFKSNYKETIKKFHNLPELWTENNDKNIIETLTELEKIGGEWEIVTVRKTEIDYIYYSNVLESIPFFNGFGSKETIIKSNTKYGVLPVKLTRTAPNKERKTIREYKFL